MENTGKLLTLCGLSLAVIGSIIWMVGSRFPNFRFGRLPGDLVIEKPQFSLYFPIATMVLVSVAISGLMWLIGALKR